MKTLVKRAVCVFSLIVVSWFAAFATNVNAQELKIGYVNVERVLRESTLARASQSRLEAEFGRREGELVQLGIQLKDGRDKLEKNSSSILPSELSRRQRDLVDQGNELEHKRRKLQEELKMRRNEELAAVTERTQRIVNQIFEAERYDLILQDVVLAGPRIDITDKVIRALNAGPNK